MSVMPDPATLPKPGLPTRRFVLPPGDDSRLFMSFWEAIESAYDPEDPVEQVLIEMLVAAMWQARRADRLEAELLAAIPPAHQGHSHGSALIGEPEHRAALATVLRYQATAGHAVRRAMDGFLKHRKARRAGLIGGEADEERRAGLGSPHPLDRAAIKPPPSAGEGARGAAAAEAASPPPSPPPSPSAPPAPPPLTPPLPKAGGRSQSDRRVGAFLSPSACTNEPKPPRTPEPAPRLDRGEPEPRPTYSAARTPSAACTNEPDTRPAAPAACTNEPDARPAAPAACTNEPDARPTAPAACTNEPDARPTAPAACTNEPEPRHTSSAARTPEPAPRRDRGEPTAKPAAPPTPAKKPFTYWAKEPLPPHLKPQQPPAPGRKWP